MKFFSMKPGNTVVMKWADERTAEFTSNSAAKQDTDSLIARFERLRAFDTPIYTMQRLAHFFPQMFEVSETEYAEFLAQINEYDKEAAAVDAEVNAMAPADLNRYISTFSIANGNLLSFAEVNRLVSAFNELREFDEGDDTEDDGDDDLIEEDQALEYSKAIYSLLRSIEKTGDATPVKQILRLIED